MSGDVKGCAPALAETSLATLRVNASSIPDHSCSGCFRKVSTPRSFVRELSLLCSSHCTASGLAKFGETC